MKIAINMSALRGHGTTVVGQNVLRQFARNPRNNSYEAWVPSAWGWGEGDLGDRFRLHNCRSGGFQKFYIENIEIRFALSRFDCMFSFGDTSLPFCRIPHIVMVQQPYFANDINELDFRVPKSFLLKQRMLEAYFKMMMPTVSQLTVQTHTMKNRIAKRWNIDPLSIRIIPSATDTTFVEKLPGAVDLTRPFINYVASGASHKNHVILPKVMRHLQDAGLDVVCYLTIGPGDVPSFTAQAEELHVIDRFVFLGPVSQDEAITLMSKSCATIMPSKLETFGLPYYEAMSVGCPVVVADKEFAREACGSAALYSDANDSRAFANNLMKLIRDKDYRAGKSKESLARSLEICRSWESIASEYLDLMESVTERRNGK